MIGHEKVLAAVGMRFDHYSARVVLGEALRKVGIAQKEAYSADEVRAISGALKGLARTEELVSTLNAFADADAAPAPQPETPLEPAFEAPAEPPAEAPAEAAPEAPAEPPAEAPAEVAPEAASEAQEVVAEKPKGKKKK